MNSFLFGLLMSWSNLAVALSSTGCGRLISKGDVQGTAFTGVAQCYGLDQPVVGLAGTQTVVIESVPAEPRVVQQITAPSGVFVIWRYWIANCHYYRVGVVSATKTYIWGRSIPSCGPAPITAHLVGHKLVITIPADHTLRVFQRTFQIDTNTFKWDSF